MSFSFFPSRSLLLLLATIRRPKTTAVSNRMSGRAQRALDLIAAADEASVGCPLSRLHPASTLRDQETSLERNAVPILCPILKRFGILCSAHALFSKAKGRPAGPSIRFKYLHLPDH